MADEGIRIVREWLEAATPAEESKDLPCPAPAGGEGRSAPPCPTPLPHRTPPSPPISPPSPPCPGTPGTPGRGVGRPWCLGGAGRGTRGGGAAGDAGVGPAGAVSQRCPVDEGWCQSVLGAFAEDRDPPFPWSLGELGGLRAGPGVANGVLWVGGGGQWGAVGHMGQPTGRREHMRWPMGICGWWPMGCCGQGGQPMGSWDV